MKKLFFLLCFLMAARPGWASTIGYTTDGASYYNMDANKIYAYKVTVTETAQISKATGRFLNYTGSNYGWVKVVIYNDSSNAPGTIVATSAGYNVPYNSTAWYDITISATLSPGTYWIAAVGKDHQTIRIYGASGMPAGSSYTVADSYTSPTSTCPGGGNSGTIYFSLYLTYTAPSSTQSFYTVIEE